MRGMNLQEAANKAEYATATASHQGGRAVVCAMHAVTASSTIILVLQPHSSQRHATSASQGVEHSSTQPCQPSAAPLHRLLLGPFASQPPPPRPAPLVQAFPVHPPLPCAQPQASVPPRVCSFSSARCCTLTTACCALSSSCCALTTACCALTAPCYTPTSARHSRRSSSVAVACRARFPHKLPPSAGCT